MRTLLCLIAAVALAATCSWALLDDNSTNLDSHQDQQQKQSAVASQAQNQGQLGIVGQKAQNDQDVTIEGDSTKVNAPTWPTTPSTEGKNEQTIYSLFGGIGNNKTEAHLRLTHQMQITEKLFADGVIDQQTYKKDTAAAYSALKKNNADPRILGFIPVGCKNPIFSNTVCF